MEHFGWYFEMFDNSSANAANASKGIRDVTRSLKELEIQAKRTELENIQKLGPMTQADSIRATRLQLQIQRDALMQTKDAAEQAKGGFGGFTEALSGAVGVAASLVAVLAGVTAVGLGLGAAGGRFAVDALAFKESTLAGLKVMTGSKEEAQAIFDDAVKIAAATPFETQDVLRAFKQLRAAGFSREEVPIVFQAVGDVAASNGFNPQVMDSLTRAFGQIKGKGKLLTEELNQIMEAAGGVVRREDVFKAIASHLGIATTAVDKAIQQGRVSPELGINSVLKAIQNTSGGQVGGQMKAQGETLTGLFSTLASAPRDIFLTAPDALFAPGLAAFKGFISNLTALLSGNSAVGQRLQAFVGRVFNDAFGGLFQDLTGTGGAEKITAFLDKVIGFLDGAWTVAKAIGGSFSAFWDTLAPFIASVGPVIARSLGMDAAGGAMSFGDALAFAGIMAAEAIGIFLEVVTFPLRVVQAMEDAGAAIRGAFADAGTWLYDAGASVVDGFVEGIKSQILRPGAAVIDMAEGAIASVQETLGIQSPSKVMRELGQNTAEGFALGVEDGAGQANAAVGGLGGEPTGGSSGAAGGRGGVVFQFGERSIVVEVKADGATPDLLEQIVTRIEEGLRPQILTVFAQMATETGMVGGG